MSRHIYADAIAHVARVTAITRRQARAVVQGLFLRAAHELEVSGRFTVPGVGVFVATTRKARRGRHPVTGVAIALPEVRSARVRPTKRGVFARRGP